MKCFTNYLIDNSCEIIFSFNPVVLNNKLYSYQQDNMDKICISSIKCISIFIYAKKKKLTNNLAKQFLEFSEL